MWFSFFAFISRVPPYSLISDDIDINFEGEEGKIICLLKIYHITNYLGIDAGGLSREFFSLILKDLIDPNKGFFTPSANGITMQPSPFSSIIPDHLLHFKYAGRILAKSILSNYSCEIDFTRSFLKQLLGNDLYISDLEDIDPELTKNLLWVLENDISELGVYFADTYT